MKHKYLLLIVGILFSIFANAYAADPTKVTIDGITYECADDEATVVGYSGAIQIANIPDAISNGGISYSVTTIKERAFYYCSSLTEVTIPKSVTFIGQNAFSSCNSLKKIFFNAENCMGSGFSLVWNGTGNTYWLYNTAIEEVIIGETVKLIPQNAFNHCTSLTKVTIPNSVITIGESAFNGSSSLTEITIPNSVTSIGERAFYSCSGLTEMTIPNSVTSIGERAFYSCSGLTKVTISNSATSIGILTFSDCSSLNEVTIPNSVISIGESAFFGCSGLTEITIPNSVTSIGRDAFSRCKNLNEVTIPNSVTTIGESAFSNCTGLKKIFYNAENCSGNGFSYNSHWLDGSYVKEVVIGESVKSLPDYAFYDCYINNIYYNAENCTVIGKEWLHLTPIKEVVIGETVKSIPAKAFRGTDLTAITIPNSVTSIGEFAFSGCKSLQKVTFLNSGVLAIDTSAFASGNNLIEVNVPSIEQWLNIAFHSSESNPTYYAKKILVNGENIRRLTIPEGIGHIGSYSFINCEQLLTVDMPSSLESVGESAFEGCTGLQRIIFPSEKDFLELSYQSEKCRCTYGNPAKIYIGSEPFGPSDFEWPEDLTRIPDYAFYGVESLTSITIPNSVEYIGKYAFYGCSNIKGKVFIPANVREINNSTFENCSGLTEVVIPNSVESIGDSAFAHCAFEKIAIPSSVKYIGQYAFLCENLKDIIIEDIISWSKIHFLNVAANPMCIARTFRIAGSEKPIEHLVLDMPGGTVSDYAFCGANNLKTVRINAGIVGKMCLYSCENLADLCLNVDNIESNAFRNASNLKNIYSMTPTPPAASDDIFSNYDGVNLYVPVGAISAYQNAENCWWRFLDVYECDFKDIDTIFKPDHDLSEVNGVLGESSDFAVSTGDGFISITAADGDQVSIYTLQGVGVHEGKGSVSLYLSPGVYIAKAGNSVKKVAVK